MLSLANIFPRGNRQSLIGLLQEVGGTRFESLEARPHLPYPNRHIWRNVVLIRILLYPIAISIYIVFMSLCHREVEWGKQSVTWPTAQAHVIRADYGGKRNGLEYNFSVAGQQYRGGRLEFCSRNAPRLKEYFNLHIKNKSEITVSYLPSDPSLSVAKPGMDGRKYYFYTFLSVAFLVAILVIEIYLQKFSAWKRSRK